ncbi:MAG: 30S ribosomal protein S7 [Planctomycetaceae bacterium]|nr:30S ribosomal protein S7 [Planctomycetota bacterium]NUN51257.1 30S ribosomal protein S7 [Planctomycetaceae bacterium]
MPRKYVSTSILQKPEPKFGNPLLSKFINCVMKQGKKSTAQRIVYDALETVGKRMPGEDPLKVFTQALNNVKPMVEVRSKRVGGATYQVPVDVSSKRQQSLAIRWLLETSRKKKGKAMSERLAEEFILASRREGGAYLTRENVHKMAEANKAFAHYAW